MPNSKISRTTPETQEDSEWAEPSGTLGELVASARIRAGAEAELAADAAVGSPASFQSAMGGENLAIIAEVKRMSPSRGAINPRLNPARQAQEYEAGGASAISVLTEPSRFGGSLADIAAVRQVTALPVLRKDFLVLESQLADARRFGASAVLLIVRAIRPDRLSLLTREARDLGLDILFEIRDETELARSLDAGATIIGVNNRNLETLEIDMATVERLLPLVPAGCLAVAESGYSTRVGAENAARAGADALLAGSFLSAAADPSEAVSSLAGIRKTARSRVT
ncbi:MAG: indole-3-glycerol phosphate synthase TrpC [Gemmatimonadaceae bacterium]